MRDYGQDMSRNQPIVPTVATMSDIERDFPGAMAYEAKQAALDASALPPKSANRCWVGLAKLYQKSEWTRNDERLCALYWSRIEQLRA